MGYHQAGFEVVGVDHRPQPRYPFRFVQADALEYLTEHGHEFDAIHASPPCQGYSAMACLPWLRDKDYPRLIEPVRAALNAIGRPWVIENVDRAPLLNGITLCGTMFGLKLYRHRRFESSVLLLAPPHLKHREVICGSRYVSDRYRSPGGRQTHLPNDNGFISVVGHMGREAFAAACAAMEIDWMTPAELSQAIPPAYTKHVGAQLLRACQ